MKEVRVKRGCLQSPSPKVRSLSPSVFHPHGEYLTSLRIMDFTIPVTEERAKDKPAASFILRNKIFHKQIGIRLWHATSEPVAELQQKTQSAGLWDKSLAQTGRYLLLQGLYPKCSMDFLISHCKDITLLDSLQEIKRNLNNVHIHNNIIYVN